MTYMDTLSENELLRSIWTALRRMEELLGSIRSEAPVVNVDPPDLTDIVTAVNGLKPGATAEDIAAAIRAELQPGRTMEETDNAVLHKLVTSLEKLDFRLQGVGNQSFGGGSVSFAPGVTVPLAPDATMATRDQVMVPKGFVQATTAGTATTLSPPAGSVYVLVQADNPIRYRDDGVAPTAAVGVRIPADGTLFYTGDLTAFRFIGVASGAVVNLAYYGVA